VLSGQEDDTTTYYFSDQACWFLSSSSGSKVVGSFSGQVAGCATLACTPSCVNTVVYFCIMASNDDNISLKLHYFNLRARGEILRYMLLHSRLPWEDNVVARNDWEAGMYEFLPPGSSGKRLLPVLSVAFTKTNPPSTTHLPESHDIARWIAERCEPTLLGKSPEEQDKIKRLWEYADKVQDIVDPILNWFPVEETEERIRHYLQEIFLDDLSFLSNEIQDGPYVCGANLSYADFIVFHVLDNLCTLMGEENVLDRAAPDATLRTFYDKMYRLPAISGRMMERPLAGRNEVGQAGSIIYSVKVPSKLEFMQAAWKDTFGK
jgi:glutathione S-transferase